MLKFLSGICVLLVGIQSFATTAVLCGNEEAVDADNDQALVWLILSNFDTTTKTEVDVTYSGKDAQVTAISRKSGVLSITTTNPTSRLILKEADIDPAHCESETPFSVKVETSRTLESIGECRCFQD